eukprot:3927118-Rhodomonas_salina.1
MSGTDLAYGGISLRVRYAMSGTDLVYGAATSWSLVGTMRLPRVSYQPTRVLCDVRLSAYARAMRCPVLMWAMILRAYYAMSDTEIGYGATPGAAAEAMSLKQWRRHKVTRYYLLRAISYALTTRSPAPGVLREGRLCTCYAECGTDVGYGDARLRAVSKLKRAWLHSGRQLNQVHRDREQQRQRQRQKHRQRGIEREKHTHTHTHEIHSVRVATRWPTAEPGAQTHTETHRRTHTHTGRKRETERGRVAETQTQRHTERQTETHTLWPAAEPGAQRQRQRQTDRQTHGGIQRQRQRHAHKTDTQTHRQHMLLRAVHVRCYALSSTDVVRCYQLNRESLENDITLAVRARVLSAYPRAMRWPVLMYTDVAHVAMCAMRLT